MALLFAVSFGIVKGQQQGGAGSSGNWYSDYQAQQGGGESTLKSPLVADDA